MTNNEMTSKGAVVITGTSTGIGKACALTLDKAGFQVFAGVRKETDATTIKQDASERLTPIMIDVTDQQSIETAAKTVENAVGEAGIKGLVNNAGMPSGGMIEFVPIEDVRKILEVNVVGQIAVSQAFIPLLRKAKGRIVNMGSVAGRFSGPFMGTYAASKFAFEAITDSLRVELQSWGIFVTIIEPGAIATPIWDKAKSNADRMDSKVPDDAKVLYGTAITSMRKAVDRVSSEAISTDYVAQAVLHALTSARPKTRYLVGKDARVQAAIAKLLPDRLRDKLITRLLRLPKRI